MLGPIVKLTLKPEFTEQFQAIFKERKHLIASFDGCGGVSLLRDIANPNIFFTYSTWTSEDKLNAYRNAELFKETWSEAKKLFAGKPEAWSVEMAG